MAGQTLSELEAGLIGEHQSRPGGSKGASGSLYSPTRLSKVMPAALAIVHLDFEIDAADWRSRAIGA